VNENNIDSVRCKEIRTLEIRLIKSRRMGWAGHVARMGEMRNLYKIFFGMPERKIPFGRS
jgi:hypothetical protein